MENLQLLQITVGQPVRTKEPTPTKVKVAAKDKVVEREITNRTFLFLYKFIF